MALGRIGFFGSYQSLCNTQVESSKFTHPLITCAGHVVKTNSVRHQKSKEKIKKIRAEQTRTSNLGVGSGAMEE